MPNEYEAFSEKNIIMSIAFRESALVPHKYREVYFIGAIMEVWKDIDGFEGLYQVSNYGRVKNIKTEKVLTNVLHHSGYVMVGLPKNKRVKCFNVHRLVAKAFLPNPQNLPCVNHKDENKQNNFVENLEWCTQQYNNTYGTRIEKARIGISKKVLQYDLDGHFIHTWESLTEASRVLNISKSAISQCCTGQHRYAGGYVWKYEKAVK